MLTSERIAQLRNRFGGTSLPARKPEGKFIIDMAGSDVVVLFHALRVAEAALPVAESWRESLLGFVGSGWQESLNNLGRAVRGGEEPLPEKPICGATWRTYVCDLPPNDDHAFHHQTETSATWPRVSPQEASSHVEEAARMQREAPSPSPEDREDIRCVAMMAARLAAAPRLVARDPVASADLLFRAAQRAMRETP